MTGEDTSKVLSGRAGCWTSCQVERNALHSSLNGRTNSQDQKISTRKRIVAVTTTRQQGPDSGFGPLGPGTDAAAVCPTYTISNALILRTR